MSGWQKVRGGRVVVKVGVIYVHNWEVDDHHLLPAVAFFPNHRLRILKVNWVRALKR